MEDSDEGRIEKLREQQARVARRERQAAQETPDADDARASDRRAQKAAYLAAKLAKRERSESEP
jgi:hypothetical protein